jgi:hypothetical protein
MSTKGDNMTVDYNILNPSMDANTRTNPKGYVTSGRWPLFPNVAASLPGKTVTFSQNMTSPAFLGGIVDSVVHVPAPGDKSSRYVIVFKGDHDLVGDTSHYGIENQYPVRKI